jgi:hypothetical protein
MLPTLKFVQGAVAKKDYVPTLTHFNIGNGRVVGFNGAIAISCPIDIGLTCAPKARAFVKAIETCSDTIEMSMTSAGKLAIRSGPFNVFVECTEEPFPDVKPEGVTVKPTGNMLEALERLVSFVGEDASRPWARGILFRGASAFATNNIVAIEFWLGYTFPMELNIPEEVVKELLRIREEPILLQMNENSVTFHFEGDRWLRTQQLSTKWPEVDKILERESTQQPFPADFYPAMEKVLPFIDEHERLFFHTDRVSTSATDGVGASVVVPGIVEGPLFNVKQLQKLEGIIKSIDFSMYPNPCIFYGDRLRGAILGMRP